MKYHILDNLQIFKVDDRKKMSIAIVLTLLCMSAMIAGQTPFEKIIKKYNIDNKNGKISIDKDYKTNIKGVFAGGDAVNGGKEVVDAVEDGKKGAKAILSYLKIN